MKCERKKSVVSTESLPPLTIIVLLSDCRSEWTRVLKNYHTFQTHKKYQEIPSIFSLFVMYFQVSTPVYSEIRPLLVPSSFKSTSSTENLVLLYLCRLRRSISSVIVLSVSPSFHTLSRALGQVSLSVHTLFPLSDNPVHNIW